MKRVPGACPHDCPDTCAWQVEVDDDGRAVAVRGPRSPLTRGALCVSSTYPERVWPDGSSTAAPVGPKGSGRFARVSWDEALDLAVTHLRTVSRATVR